MPPSLLHHDWAPPQKRCQDTGGQMAECSPGPGHAEMSKWVSDPLLIPHFSSPHEPGRGVLLPSFHWPRLGGLECLVRCLRPRHQRTWQGSSCVTVEALSVDPGERRALATSVFLLWTNCLLKPIRGAHLVLTGQLARHLQRGPRGFWVEGVPRRILADPSD